MRIIKFLFSPLFMGILFVVFAVAMAIATFVENDLGSGASYSMVYNARWFELILLLLVTNLIGQLLIFKLFRKSKLPVALFHLSFIIIIIGAGITRYFGWEGTIHIREGETANRCFSNEKYIRYTVKNKGGDVIAKDSRKYAISSVSAENYKRKIKAGDKTYKLSLEQILPNAAETIIDSPDGVPIISMFVTNEMKSRENIILKKGESKTCNGITIGFESGNETDIKISIDNRDFFISSKYNIGQMKMMTQENEISEPGNLVKMKQMQIIKVKDINIVPRKLSAAGNIKIISLNSDEQETGQNAFIFNLTDGKESIPVNLWDKESQEGGTGLCSMNGLEFEVKFGSKITVLPFSLKLNDFLLEKYPGSENPSGYKSDVTLFDKENNIEKPYKIFMNNILKYKGYRFYQSSFDKDENGTILSVNHDMAGMIVTYTGYALLFIFIILSLFSKNSQFRNIKAVSWNSGLRKGIIASFFFLILSGLTTINAQKFIPGKESSDEFGKVLVQDQKGRTKPLFTLSNDILRKVTRENKFEDYSSMQVFLGLYFDFKNWKNVPLIRISNKDLRKKLGINDNLASFSDLVNLNNGDYKLSKDVTAAYAKSPGERNKLDKEVMKIDERVNIVYMIYRGEFMQMFPLKNGTRDWGSPEVALKAAISKEDSLFIQNIFPLLIEALQNNNVATVRKISESLSGYQKIFSNYELPSESKTKAEILYYRLGIFEKLFPFYAATGLIMLIGLILIVLTSSKKKSSLIKILSWLIFAGFLLHTFGLGLRWYIAGHSPLSNGYESMIFISWVTLLAGFIFTRKSNFALSATAVLAGMTLMVAHLSFMDPEITNLVPVLKSYWLTLHVSVITGSYGFLGLGAILGIITMILLILVNSKNQERISKTVDELIVINYRTLTLGLYFLTIGTFLGAVWANESWGRYWGWDPKETWSLITIILYAFVIHSRMIPGMKNIYAFNILSLFAFSSVLMTYFGVNYYLSGLHSYASGDPVPVPGFVYVTVIILISLCVTAFLKYKTFQKASK
ncbi:MAG: c-type cytochrome biogenesis protein CcsB [Bacteroidia bacterium]|nr:c-type cytochrome biogenesis protein CcsB [Bacteroidia bacterium]